MNLHCLPFCALLILFFPHYWPFLSSRESVLFFFPPFPYHQQVRPSRKNPPLSSSPASVHTKPFLFPPFFFFFFSHPVANVEYFSSLCEQVTPLLPFLLDQWSPDSKSISLYPFSLPFFPLFGNETPVRFGAVHQTSSSFPPPRLTNVLVSNWHFSLFPPLPPVLSSSFRKRC